jgi:hypothetical protein
MAEEASKKKSRQASIDRPETDSPPESPLKKTSALAPASELALSPAALKRPEARDLLHRKHVMGFLGKRVQVCSPPHGQSSSHKHLVVGRSGVCMKVHHRRRGIYDVALDDGRVIQVPRACLALDGAVAHPCDIRLEAQGLKVLDW